MAEDPRQIATEHPDPRRQDTDPAFPCSTSPTATVWSAKPTASSWNLRADSGQRDAMVEAGRHEEGTVVRFEGCFLITIAFSRSPSALMGSAIACRALGRAGEHVHLHAGDVRDQLPPTGYGRRERSRNVS